MIDVLTVGVYSLVGCASMAVQDVAGTIKNIAQNRGRAKDAGNADVVNDAAGLLLASFSAERLTYFGPVGWLAILPILATGRFVTRRSTRWAHHHYRKGGDEDSSRNP